MTVSLEQCTKCGELKDRDGGFYWSPNSQGIRKPMKQCKDCRKAAISAQQLVAKLTPKPRSKKPKCCARCRKTKAASAFYTKKTNKDGLRAYCKDCEGVDNRERHKKRVDTLDYPPTTKPKTCSVCEVTKPARSFNINRTLTTGRVAQCKDCEKKYRGERNFPRRTHPKTCNNCGRAKLPDRMFYADPYYPDGRESRCKVCVHKKKYNPDGRYTAHDYLRIEKKQGGHCYFYGESDSCDENGKADAGLHIDHDHKNGVIRGLLCHYHNRTVVPEFDKLTLEKIQRLIVYTGKQNVSSSSRKNVSRR